ncbi:MAG: MMPL family transporter [Candidatus Heimdallarchaeota archaeon]|nr:MMPL family transporter [Candidatus Heimdallarchaeota archaeon]
MSKEENKTRNDKNTNNTKKQGRKRTDAFFEWFGNFVTKRYKIILILGILSAGAAIYPAILLQGELKYNDTEFLPENLESDLGIAILDEQFPTNVSRGSTLILLDSDIPIIAQENLEFINELTSRIYNSNYTDIIANVDSLVSIFDTFLSTYWAEMNATYDLVHNFIYNNISVANYAMHNAANEIASALKQIAGLYQMTWFNFSRTYFYGLFEADLFTSGPLNTTVQEIIANYTDFTSGFVISPEYSQIVHQIATTQLPHYSLVNDVIINQISYSITNSTLAAYAESHEQYQNSIAPLLSLYYQNWTVYFDQLITQTGISIVNGTSIINNEYENDSIFNAYMSQIDVLNSLALINYTIFNNIDIREMILAQANHFLDFTGTDFEEYIDPAYFPTIIAQIYDLGENPSELAIENLTQNIAMMVISSIIAENPPETSIQEFVANSYYKYIIMWVLSNDGKTTLISITYDVHSFDSEAQAALLVEVDRFIGELAHSLITELNLTQSRVYHTGEIFITESIVKYSEEAASGIDIIAGVLVFIVLVIVFTSLIAPLIPLLTIGLSIAISFAFLYWIAQAMNIHYLSTLILTIVSMGAGVDYCIFIYSRYHEELERGKTKEEAVKKAIIYAGESVFHSGLTVLVGFGALIIPNFPYLRSLGIAMIIGISFSIMCALLIVPSLLMLLGNAVFWPRGLERILRPQKWFKKKALNTETKENLKIIEEDIPNGSSLKHKRQKKRKETIKSNDPATLRFGKFVTRNGLKFFILSLVAFAPFVYFTITLETSTDFMNMLPDGFEGNDATAILDQKMAFGNPINIQVVFHNLPVDPRTSDALFDTDRLCIRILAMENVKTIRTTVRPLGNIALPYTNPEALDFYDDLINDFVGIDERTIFMEIYLDVDAYSEESYNFVKNLDSVIDDVIENVGLATFAGSNIYVTGVAREFYEMKQVTEESYPIIIPVVIVGVFFILFFLFGSYFTPIRLIITIGMSIIFTLAMVNIVYIIGFGVPVLWLLPIMMFSILMGLGLDYDIFLVSRIKEYCQLGMTDKDAIAHALHHTSTIITSCGLVMAAAFSSLLFSNLWHISELGFAFTLSIILDATFIRLVLVPSIMVLFEKYNWLGPKWIQKVHRIPSVTAAMKVLGDSLGIEIYTLELKESLELVVENSLAPTDPEILASEMFPEIERILGDEKVTIEIKDSIKNAIAKKIA